MTRARELEITRLASLYAQSVADTPRAREMTTAAIATCAAAAAIVLMQPRHPNYEVVRARAQVAADADSAARAAARAA